MQATGPASYARGRLPGEGRAGWEGRASRAASPTQGLGHRSRPRRPGRAGKRNKSAFVERRPPGGSHTMDAGAGAAAGPSAAPSSTGRHTATHTHIHTHGTSPTHRESAGPADSPQGRLRSPAVLAAAAFPRLSLCRSRRHVTPTRQRGRGEEAGPRGGTPPHVTGSLHGGPGPAPRLPGAARAGISNARDCARRGGGLSCTRPAGGYTPASAEPPPRVSYQVTWQGEPLSCN